MVLRIIFQEMFLNKYIGKKLYRGLTLFSSGFLLTGAAVFECLMLSLHKDNFSYNAETKEGNLVCFQNRIVYVTEIVLCFLTVIKDIFFIILGKDKEEESI